MPRQTETNSPVNAFPHSPPTQDRLRSRRRTPWRLARSAVIVQGAGAVAALAAILLTSTPGKEAFAVPPTCPPLLEPGPARPWEAQVSVSTYSSVNTHNGNVFTAIPIVSWSGRGPDMNMMLYHNSANAASGYSIADVVGFNLGPGWSLSYSDHLRLNELPNNKVTLVADDGTQDVFTWNGTIWQPPFGVYDTLYEDTLTGKWILKHKDQSYHQFSMFSCSDGIARLEKIFDATGNSATVSYTACNPVNPNVHVRLQGVTAGGRPLNFAFGESGPDAGRLLNLVDPRDGDVSTHDRQWTFHYYAPGDFDAGWLNQLEDAMQYENRAGWNYFTYDTNGRLVTVSDKCNTQAIGACSEAILSDPSTLRDKYRYTYTAVGRAYQVFDPTGVGGGRTQTFSFVCYQPSDFLSKTITTYTNRRGFTWQYKYRESALLALEIKPGTLELIADMVGTTLYYFDGSFNLVWFSDANSNQWRATYDSRGNLLTLTDPIDHVQSRAYDVWNNVYAQTDAAGNTVRYYYDLAAYPTLLTRIVEPCNVEPSGGVPCATPNPPAWQLPGAEGNYPVTRLAYYLGTSTLDAYGFGQLKEVTDPNGVWTGFEYDQWGQQAKYSEGRVTPTSSAVYCLQTTNDSGGRTISTNSSCGGGQTASGGGGSSGYDSNNNQTSSTCIAAASGSTAAAGSWPPMTLPCNPPAIPGRSAEFSTATYSPKGELQVLPLSLGIGARTNRRTYDVMGRPLSVSVESNEAGGTPVTRTFTHSYDVANGKYTRTGPDGVDTYVELDSVDRVQYVRRGPAAAPLMTATYAYRPNGYVDSITYGNVTRVQYVYDRHRLAAIEHQRGINFSERLLRLDYEYTANDLPWRITEYGPGMPGAPAQALTTFTYDRRARLIHESRVYYPNLYDPTKNYDLAYQYDKGGNRTVKIDHDYLHPRRVQYHYDVDAGANPNVYGSLNNRLMWYETLDTTNPSWPQTISKTYYVYTYDSTYGPGRTGKTDGNPTRIITEYPSSGGGQQNAAMSAPAGPAMDESPSPLPGSDEPTGEGGSEGWGEGGIMAVSPVDDSPSPSQGEGWGEGGGAAAMAAPPPPPPTGGSQYTAVRLGYANNGRTVTFAHGETWTGSSGCPTSDYQIPWAREFRYDGARARYLDRKLNAWLFALGVVDPDDEIWTDYDGDDAYLEYRVTSTNPSQFQQLSAYEPGLWRQMGFAGQYLHGDHLGTLRETSNVGLEGTGLRTFTAFGERIAGPTDRFGYVGAFGYQAHSIAESTNPDTAFPYLHVGARYYDPSSGRFLQRDPIGIRGGLNVYAYVGNAPTRRIDPKGRQAGSGAPAPLPPFAGIPETPGADFDPPESTGNLGYDLLNGLACAPGSPSTMHFSPPQPPPCPPEGCPPPVMSDPRNNPGPCGPGTGGGAAGGLLVLFALRYRRRSVNLRRIPDTNPTQMTVRLAHQRFQHRGDVLIRRRPIVKK